MPSGGSVDRIAARELFLYSKNYRAYPEYVKNQLRKMKRGVYDREKAVRLWEYLAERAARAYGDPMGAEYHFENAWTGRGSRANPIPSEFNRATRRAAAIMLRDDFERDVGWRR